ncbi:MAG: hemolysin family protein [Acidimicrobiia bacterium]|nr:hemolysin family protein [Acidimicrobiia bacterium]
MSGTRIVYLVILGLCTLGSGFFSGSETALIGIGRERVHQLADQAGRRGRRVQQLVTEPDRLLSTLLVANNLVNILGAAVATTLFIDLVGAEWGPWAATAAVTTVILIFGEITPKTLAARYPERFSLAVAPTIYRLSKFLGPVARTFTAITRGFFRLLRLPTQGGVSAATEDDIRALSQLSLAEGEIEAVEHEILDALFTLADRPVREVMTPRVDIVTLTDPVDIASVRATVAKTGHSRYPVAAGNLDHLLGVLYVKDLLQLPKDPGPEEIQRLLRTPRFVPESAPIMNVLHDLRRGRSAFAVVLDEHGGVDGLVTVKDLVSELVGELQDEYDPGAPSVVLIGPGEWLTDGRVPIEDLAEAIGVDLPQGEYTTAGGLLMDVAGRIPDEGDVVVVDHVVFTVLQMDRNRVDRIRVEQK